MEEPILVGLTIIGVLIIVLILIKIWVEMRIKTMERAYSNQTADIWNISGRVNHQEGPVTSEPQRWPTHDHHVSIDSFVVPQNFHPQKLDRVPPPPYSEVDLPTYEQATGVSRPNNELASVHVAPSSSRNCAGSTS